MINLKQADDVTVLISPHLREPVQLKKQGESPGLPNDPRCPKEQSFENSQLLPVCPSISTLSK
jgi:hypothetical protein